MFMKTKGRSSLEIKEKVRPAIGGANFIKGNSGSSPVLS